VSRQCINDTQNPLTSQISLPHNDQEINITEKCKRDK